MQRIQFDQKRELSQIVDDSYRFIKQNFGELMVLLLVSVAPFLFVIQAVLHKLTPTDADPSSLASAGMLLLIFSGHALLQTAVYGFIFAKINGNAFTRDELWPYIRLHFLPMLSTVSSLVIVLVLGFLALIVPGIFLMVPLSMVFVHRLRTGEPFFVSVPFLLNLVRGQWFATLAVLLISTAVIYGASMMLLVPHYFWGFDPKIPTTEGSAISSACYAVFSIVTSMVAVPITMQYFNLLKRKEC